MLGIKLTKLGAGEYWEDVDRCVRNQFVENQITRTDWVDRMPADAEPNPYRITRGKIWSLQLWEDETDAVERAVGSWAGWAAANDGRHLRLMQCCIGNAGRSMYYVWDSIVTKERDTVRVNLHRNRASRWLDVESHLPYAGKVVLRLKETANLAVRIPEWTDRRGVTCRLNGQEQEFAWSGSYIKLSGLEEGDEVIVEFPMRQVTVFKEIGDRPYKLVIKGNTVVDISPEGTIYPLYQRDHYMQDKAPVKRVNRFVSREAVLW